MTDDFHHELRAILLAEPGAEARDRLAESCRRRSVAGMAGFSYPLDVTEPWDVRLAWAEDFSGELDGIALDRVAEEGLAATPAWLLRWILRRTRPFHLRQVARFIPFSARMVLRATAPSGRRPLADFIVVPYRSGGQGVGALIGLHAPVAETISRELVTLASAGLARQPWPDVADHRAGLNERQLECLQWIVAGKSMAETAELTNMSYANVRYHLERAKSRTGLGSLQQLIAHAAVEYNLSPLGPDRAD